MPKSVTGQVLGWIDPLKDNPFPRQAGKRHRAEHVYRIRVDDNRLVFKVETVARRIVIQYVRHRRKAQKLIIRLQYWIGLQIR